MMKIVAKKTDGTLVKGTTRDFLPNKNLFHVESAGKESLELYVNDLKALFFVRKLEGNRAPHCGPPQKRHAAETSLGKRIQVTFQDGEVIDGYSHSLHLDRLGFFIVPLDPECNNTRIFVVLTSIKGLIVEGTKVVISSSGFKLDKPCRTCGTLPDLDWKFCPYDGSKVL